MWYYYNINEFKDLKEKIYKTNCSDPIYLYLNCEFENIKGHNHCKKELWEMNDCFDILDFMETTKSFKGK